MTIPNQDQGLVYFQTQMVSFKVNVSVKHTIATSAHIDENFRTNWDSLLIFNWKADHTVEEKHSHNKHLHINKTLQNPNLENIKK